MTQYLYIVSMDIPENLESEFNRIYDTQHIPNILNVSGVESCTRYRTSSTDVDGTAKYTAIYEITDPGVPFSKEWQGESDKGDWPVQIRPGTLNRSHIVLEKL